MTKNIIIIASNCANESVTTIPSIKPILKSKEEVIELAVLIILTYKYVY